MYPAVFEKYLELENQDKLAAIQAEVTAQKKAEEAAKAEEEAKRLAILQEQKETWRKSVGYSDKIKKEKHFTIGTG